VLNANTPDSERSIYFKGLFDAANTLAQTQLGMKIEWDEGRVSKEDGQIDRIITLKEIRKTTLCLVNKKDFSDYEFL
jgi:hypothetical protein